MKTAYQSPQRHAPVTVLAWPVERFSAAPANVPLMVLLTAAVLLFVRRHRISLIQAMLLLLVYLVWIGIHLAL